MELAASIIFVGALLVLVSICLGLASNRIGAPLLVVFLGVGMLFGEDGPVGIVFNDMQLAYLAGSLGLAVILFDGGLRTPSATFRLALGPASVLATVGVLITTGVVGAAAVYLFHVEWLHGLLIGAILASTDAAAVFLLLHQRQRTLRPRVGATLEVESGINDPMAVFLTISLVELVMRQGHTAMGLIPFFLWQMTSGVGVGYFGGKLIVWLVNRLPLSGGLSPILVLSCSVLVFSGTHLIGGSGFMAVYLAGLVVGNADIRRKESMTRFYDGLAWLAQIGMFLMIGLLVTPSSLMTQFVPACIIAAVLIFVARPLAVLACLWPFRFGWKEQTFVAWVGLRGAVPIFLAIIPTLSGLETDRTIFNVAFVVVVISLVLQGWSVFLAARLLDVEAHADNEIEHLRQGMG